MPKLRKVSLPGSISSDHKPSSRRITLVTFLSKQQRHVTLPVRIVLAKGHARIWTIDSSGKLSMRLLDTDLEALAFTFLANHSYIRGSLTLSVISNGGVRATLSCLLPMAQRSMTVSKTLYPVGLTKPTGLGDLRQDLKQSPY